MKNRTLPSFIQNPAIRFAEPSDYETEHSEQIFLEALQGKQNVVQIYLISGIKMVGRILGIDEFTILLSTKSGGSQMLYKHAITTISGYEEDK